MSAIKVYQSGILCVIESSVVGHYRGEDSGAIYPEFEYNTIEKYNITPILDHEIDGKTIRDLIALSDRLYPYAGEMHTSVQASSIYRYLNTLDNKDEMKIKL